MTWKISRLALASVLAIGLAVSGSSTAFAETTTTQEKGVMELFRDLEIEMAAVAEHAAKLDQMVEWPNRYDLSIHHFEWSMLRERMNEAGKLVPKLQNASDSQPWQKQVVDEISALMGAAEKQVEHAYKLKEDVVSAERLFTKTLYKVRIRSVYHYAEHIDDLIEYAQERSGTTTT